MRINFYSGQETLAQVGHDNWVILDWIKEESGRVESFEMAADEQLIGAEIYDDDVYFRGVTFLKCKI